MHRFLILVFAAALAACAQVDTAALQRDTTAANEYCADLYADSRLDPIREKLGLDGSPSIQALTDKSTPTPAEKQALAAFFPLRQQCNGRYNQALAANWPAAALAHSETVSRYSQMLARLYAGEITYAQALAATLEINRAYDQRLYALENQMVAEQRAAAQRASGVMMQLSNQQAAKEMQQNRGASFTNCVPTPGGGVSCTTY